MSGTAAASPREDGIRFAGVQCFSATFSIPAATTLCAAPISFNWKVLAIGIVNNLVMRHRRRHILEVATRLRRSQTASTADGPKRTARPSMRSSSFGLA